MEDTYFIWKGVDSRNYGIVVSTYPDITRPQERGNEVTIPGRHGVIFVPETDHDDYPIYDQVPLSVNCHLKPWADIPTICSWLSGSGLVCFGNHPGFAYEARIIEAIPFQYLLSSSNGWRGFTINFKANPCKMQYPVQTEKDAIVIADYSNDPSKILYGRDKGSVSKIITNPGNMRVPLKCIVRAISSEAYSNNYNSYTNGGLATFNVDTRIGGATPSDTWQWINLTGIFGGASIDMTNWEFYHIHTDGNKGTRIQSGAVYETNNAGKTYHEILDPLYLYPGENQVTLQVWDGAFDYFAVIPDWRWVG